MQEVSIRKKLSDLSTCTPQVYNSTNKAIVYKCMACTCIMTLCTRLIKHGHLWYSLPWYNQLWYTSLIINLLYQSHSTTSVQTTALIHSQKL